MHRIGFVLCLLLGLAAFTGGSSTSYAQETPAAATTPAATSAEAATTAAATPAGTETPAAAPPAAPPTAAEVDAKWTFIMNTIWTMIAAFLVFFMNLGFGCVEAGMCRAKNCVNIISKNFVVFACATIAYFVCGFGFMFGKGNDWIGTEGVFALTGANEIYTGISWANVPLSCKFFFQLVFAGTCATIVSGAVAERIKYGSFIVFSFLLTMFVYPVTGHWVWGGGWLQTGKFGDNPWFGGIGFWDFAGCTAVHSVGGWAALAGVVALGPRIGKFTAEGKPTAIPGHSLPLAFIGCLVLWLGWFGFNPGSTMAADAEHICHIAMTTNFAAASAILSSTVVAWGLLGKPDLGMTLNGCLAGLVGITSACAWVTMADACVIGAIAGAIVVVAVMAFDRMKIDDPVGATSVHLVCGIFGTLAVGIWANPAVVAKSVPSLKALADAGSLPVGLIYSGSPKQLIMQLIGVAAVGAYVFVSSLVIWLVLKYTMGIRVTKEEEIEGLDVGEHGNEAYPDFVAQHHG